MEVVLVLAIKGMVKKKKKKKMMRGRKDEVKRYSASVCGVEVRR